MNLNNIIEKIKDEYSEHECLNEMVTDLSDGTYVDHWADRLCEDEFNNNKVLAKELYIVHVKEIEKDPSSREYLSVGESVSQDDKLSDKAWGRELI